MTFEPTSQDDFYVRPRCLIHSLQRDCRLCLLSLPPVGSGQTCPARQTPYSLALGASMVGVSRSRISPAASFR